MRKWLLSFYLAGACCASLTTAQCQLLSINPNLIVNGGFESYGGDSYFSNIRQGLTGWTLNNFNVYFGGIDIVEPSLGAGHYYLPAEGQVSISLNWGNPGEISQRIATQASTKYTLSFSMAGEIYGGQALRTMDVSWNGAVIGSPTFLYTGQTSNSVGWVQISYDVIGTGNDELKFTSTTPNNYGPALDAVSLIAVPEPASVCLAGLALGMHLLRRSGFRRF